MNIIVELLKRTIPLVLSLGNRVAALEEEESREAENDAILMREADALLSQLTVPTPTPNNPIGIPPMPSDII
jgi:hypothetical protein